MISDYPHDPYWTGATPDRWPRDPDDLLDDELRDDLDDDFDEEWPEEMEG